MNSRAKPQGRRQRQKIGVFKFASCDGCQLSLLDLEDEILALADTVDIAYFPEASSRMAKGPYDVGLVEGSITTQHDRERIQHVRGSCRLLVTIGACATAGGIQALRDGQNVKQWVAQVYPKPEYISTLATSTPIAAHVPVDYQLRGCPVNKHQLLEVVAAIVAGRKPSIPTDSVCMECKRRGNVCIAVATGAACLGPATQAGCGAICPAFGRGCYGCFGPMETPSAKILAEHLLQQGHPAAEVQRLFKTFNVSAAPFRQAAALVQLR